MADRTGPDGGLVVVVVTYNAADVLPTVAASLPAAVDGLELVEVVVVDNASSDGSVELAKRLLPEATVVETGRNLGYAAAFNAGVRAAGPARAYAILNPDLALGPRALTRLVETLDETGAGVAVPRLLDNDGALLPSLRRRPTVLRAAGEAVLGGRRAGRHPRLGELVVDGRAYERRSEADWASGAAMVIASACLAAVGPWEESFFLYSEETDFCLRAGDAGYRVVLEPEAEAVHIGGDAPSNPTLYALQRVSSVRLFARRHGRARTQAFRLALAAGELARSGVRRGKVHQAAWRALVSLEVGAADARIRRSPKATRSGSGRAPHVLIVVENLPVPLDRRVWLEAQALVAEDYRVSVICPKGPGDPSYEELDGVRLHKYPPFPTTRGAMSFIAEFAYCWLATARLAVRIERREHIDVFQACNPPDTFFAIAALLKLRGTRFLFDQHDLCPEIYMTKFADERGALLKGLFLLEGLTYRTADHVIATNESYRRIALERGGLEASQVTVVRNGPDLDRLYRVPEQPELREGRRYLAVYLGIMGPQDGVDVVLRAAAVLRDDFGRDDIHFALLGFGDSLEDLHRLASELGLDDRVTFTGRADDEMIRAYLSTADIGLSPDPPTPFNDASTMNKTMEYMAFGLPLVAFDLTETRYSAGDAALYAEDGTAEGFAAGCAVLVDDEALRRHKGSAGLQRVVEELAWEHQRPSYTRTLSTMCGVQTAPRAAGLL